MAARRRHINDTCGYVFGYWCVRKSPRERARAQGSEREGGSARERSETDIE